MDSTMKIIMLKINKIIVQHYPPTPPTPRPKIPTQTNHARGIEKNFWVHSGLGLRTFHCAPYVAPLQKGEQ